MGLGKLCPGASKARYSDVAAENGWGARHTATRVAMAAKGTYFRCTRHGPALNPTQTTGEMRSRTGNGNGARLDRNQEGSTPDREKATAGTGISWARKHSKRSHPAQKQEGQKCQMSKGTGYKGHTSSVGVPIPPPQVRHAKMLAMICSQFLFLLN
jgi:hypothetical protein